MGRLYPNPRDFEPVDLNVSVRGFPRTYWVYLIGSALVAAGYADYSLVAYHFHRTGIMPMGWIPALYGLAMAVDALAALLFGRWFDRAGIRVLLISTLLSAGFAPLVFGDRLAFAALGMILWGTGMRAQESIMRAAIADMTPQMQRATAYGVFNVAYGVSWFVGSGCMGWLYGQSLNALVTFSVLAQLLAMACFHRAAQATR